MIKFFFSFVVSLFLYNLVLPIFIKYNLEKPNDRSSHILPTPSGGGLIFLLSITISAFITKEIYFLPIIILSLVGYLDDLFKLNQKNRFFIQLLCSIFLLINSPFFDLIYNQNFIVFLLLTFLCLLVSCSLINFFNFMDGIDGLIAGCSLIIFSTLVFSTGIDILFLLGSIGAFLILNWFPAKLFMGDSGSTLLGALFVLFVFQANSFEEAIRIFLISTPIVFDALVCILRRFASKQNIFKPHKLHLYQRLVMAGFKESLVSSIYILSTFILSIAYLYFSTTTLFGLGLIFLIIAYILDSKFSISFDSSLSN